MGLEPTNLLTASQALYQLSYAPRTVGHVISTTRHPLRPVPAYELAGLVMGPRVPVS